MVSFYGCSTVDGQDGIGSSGWVRYKAPTESLETQKHSSWNHEPTQLQVVIMIVILKYLRSSVGRPQKFFPALFGNFCRNLRIFWL